MTEIDLTVMTDEDLGALRVAVLTEQERRANLAAIPEQIRQFARTYLDGGGDPSVLEQAVTGAEEATRG